MSANLGKIMLPLVNQEFVAKLLTECMSASSENHQTVGKWAHGVSSRSASFEGVQGNVVHR